MDKRLRIAKELLSKTGVIFISIGDDEEVNLQLLCKQIFHEANYIETYLWISTTRPDNSSPIYRRNAEFVLCIAKNKPSIPYFNGVISSTSGMPSLSKTKEKIKTITFPANSVHTNLSDGIYHAGIKENGRNPKWELLNDVEAKDGLFITPVSVKGHSYWATDKKIKEELAAGTEIWIKSETFVPYYKKAKESINRPTKILPVEYTKDGIYANTELNDGIFDHKVFNNPKPSTLISFLINFIDKKNIRVLDFFAGSGTTLHATMALNNEDGGHRQCILVTNNENGICENVTYERNKRVIKGYTTPKGEVVEGLKKNNLRYYRTDFVDRDRTTKNMRALVSAATDMLCIKEDMYTEQPQFGNINLPKVAARHFTDSKREMLIIYKEECIEELVDEIYDINFNGKLKVYVFSPDRDPYEDEFIDVEDKVELCALPAAIYDAYMQVIPKKKDKEVEIVPDSENEDEEVWSVEEEGEA